MTLPAAVARVTVTDPRARIQREHELNEALEAARHLQARLEMLGDRADDVASIRRLRDDLAGMVPVETVDNCPETVHNFNNICDD